MNGVFSRPTRNIVASAMLVMSPLRNPIVLQWSFHKWPSKNRNTEIFREPFKWRPPIFSKKNLSKRRPEGPHLLRKAVTLTTRGRALCPGANGSGRSRIGELAERCRGFEVIVPYPNQFGFDNVFLPAFLLWMLSRIGTRTCLTKKNLYAPTCVKVLMNIIESKQKQVHESYFQRSDCHPTCFSVSQFGDHVINLLCQDLRWGAWWRVPWHSMKVPPKSLQDV